MWQLGHKIKTLKCRLCLISKSGCCGQMFETLRWLMFISCMAFCLDNHTADHVISALLMYCRGDDIYDFIVTFLLMAQTVSSVMTMQPNHIEYEGPLLSFNVSWSQSGNMRDGHYFHPFLYFFQLYPVEGDRPKMISIFIGCSVPSCFFTVWLSLSVCGT